MRSPALSKYFNLIQNVDLEKKELEVIENKNKFQRDLNRKLETFETMAMRPSFNREKDDEEYLKSLRAAYEEESSEEDLTKRALEIKKNNRKGLVLVKDKQNYGKKSEQKNSVIKAIHNSPKNQFDEEDEEEGIRIYKKLPKQTIPDAFPTSYNPKKNHFQNEKLKEIHNMKLKTSKDYLETSEEEDQNHLKQSKKPLPTKDKRQGEELDLQNLTEEQLCLIKQMVEERLKASEPVTKKANKRRTQQEEPDLVIDDDFYDNNFLNLVYELESQKDDSLFNY